MKEAEKKFREYANALGLKSTRQRELIAQEFLSHKGHLSAEELLKRVRAIDKRISLATVYRTLKLLEASGLAESHRFGDDTTIFEPKLEVSEHHDHLICVKCGLIVEFVDDQIEKLQEKVAVKHGFRSEWHRLELYGFCGNCQE